MSEITKDLTAKYRPRKFAQVVGQDSVVARLQEDLSTGQVHNCYLMAGPPGLGKTTLARIMAARLLCKDAPQGNPNPCGKCESCNRIFGGHPHPSVLEHDAASMSGVDQVRAILEQVQWGMWNSHKVVIVDEVQATSAQGFQAWLKTLEEPPPGVVFVLCTSELGKIPQAVKSRSRLMLLKPVEDTALVRHLAGIARAECLDVSMEVLHNVAQMSGGSVRDALQALSAGIMSDGGFREDLAGRGVVGLEEYHRILRALCMDDLDTAMRTAFVLQRERAINTRELVMGIVEAATMSFIPSKLDEGTPESVVQERIALRGLRNEVGNAAVARVVKEGLRLVETPIWGPRGVIVSLVALWMAAMATGARTEAVSGDSSAIEGRSPVVDPETESVLSNLGNILEKMPWGYVIATLTGYVIDVVTGEQGVKAGSSPWYATLSELRQVNWPCEMGQLIRQNIIRRR